MNSSSATSVPSFSIGSLWATMAGAGGGLLSFFVGEIVGGMVGMGSPTTDRVTAVLTSAVWSGSIGLTIGIAILIYDNIGSLRGQWHRNLLAGIPLFFALSFVGGAMGQLAFTLMQNIITRAIGWSLMGLCVGAGVGMVRRDLIQAARGAMGGAIAGFIGGFIFDGLFVISTAGGGSLSRFVGQVLLGALIALLMRVVQDAMKSAWLLGISTGPYEGKEYPLNSSPVTVGREDSNTIALYRERELPANLGALVFYQGSWFWQGDPITINGVPQSNAPLNPGDRLQMGQTAFRFQDRSVKNPDSLQNYPQGYPRNHQQQYSAPTYSATGMPPATPQNYSAPPPQPQTVLDSFSQPPATVPATALKPQGFALMALNGQLVRLPEMNSPVTVGRTAGNQVVLLDGGVSSQHAIFQMSQGALTVTDAGSTNGTFVNGTKLNPKSPYTVRIGDRIRFGTLEYTLRTS